MHNAHIHFPKCQNSNTFSAYRLMFSIVLGLLVLILTQLLKDTAETNSQHPPYSQILITAHSCEVCSFYITFCSTTHWDCLMNR